MAHAKSTLAETTVRLGLGIPAYSTGSSGPRHDQVFTSAVTVDGEELGRGIARTKREAERLAAEEALAVLEARESGEELPDSGRFEGPWPVFGQVLSKVIEVAEKRVSPRLTDEEARIAIRDFSLELYKDILQDLGEIVEEDDEADS